MEKYDKRNIRLPKKLYNEIEEDVVNLYLELELMAPINPKEIAYKLGFILRNMSDIDEIEMQKLIRFDDKGKRRDGYSFYDPMISTFIIWVNDVDSYIYEHDDFTIMHEIGHIRMGHKEESDLANRIANYYAAYALVPSPLYTLLKCRNEGDIENTFGVSEECSVLCIDRCRKWKEFNGFSKPYEKRFRDYYEARLIDLENKRNAKI